MKVNLVWGKLYPQIKIRLLTLADLEMDNNALTKCINSLERENILVLYVCYLMFLKNH